MQKRFDYFLEMGQFPLIILFCASIMLGTGNLLVNSELAVFWDVSSNLIIQASILLKALGSFIISLFPLLLLVFILSKKYDDSHAGMIGLASYATLLVTTMIFASEKLNPVAYNSVLGLSINNVDYPSLAIAIRNPLHLGLLATFVCYRIVKHCYLKTRNRRSYGAFSFIDKNVLSLLYAIFYSLILGLIISFIWPYIINFLFIIFDFIADDITNPFNLFLYGALEKLFGVANMISIPRNVFWFSEYGGSWLDSLGRKYVGDVAIWTAQNASSMVTGGIGRFITPLYVIQIFAIPGYILALFTIYTNRFEKRKYVLFAIIAMIVSMFMGNSFPFDLFMFATTPLLFFLHVFASGVIYAFLQWLKLYIGYSFSGNISLAAAGSLADLFVYFRSTSMMASIQNLFIVGLVVFVIYFLMTRIYYKYLALDMFQSGLQRGIVVTLIDGLGGVDNIKIIDSNPFKLLIQVHDESKVNIAILRALCNSKVFESKTGYVLYFYKASYTIYADVMAEIKAYKQQVS
ncbi:MAG: hypothetical protein IKM20_06725 [Erysipelotrichales bacterium]|nr:hypothetical protein [Erysipelotrichales bacterium]